MPYVEIEGAQVHYAKRAGGNRSVVFLHGGFGSTSELWARAMDALPPGYSAYAIDNFVRSDEPPGGYSVPQFAHRAGQFIDRLGLDRPVLVGHSMGGVTIQLAALEFPERVGGLVLVCTGPSTTNHELAHQLLRDLKESEGDRETIRRMSALWFRTPPPGFFEQYVERATCASLRAMTDVQASLVATDVRGRLPTIKCAALVVWGRHDTGRTYDHADALLKGIANSELAVMEDSGHSPMIETPVAFDKAFHTFLDRVFSSRDRS
jgi:pimeloyl-ACP methyl ester carboxylesterase